MPIVRYERLYRRNEFTSILGPLPAALLAPWLTSTPGLVVPIVAVEVTPANAVVVKFADVPDDPDLLAVDARVAAFVGGATTSRPFVFESYATANNVTGDHVAKIDQQTPLLVKADYQISWVCNIRLATQVANAGVEAKIRLERSDGQFVEQPDTWDLAYPHAFNGSQPFEVEEGQQLRALLTFARLGAVGTAQMMGARIAINKLG